MAVGGYLDVTLPNLGLGTTGLTYTITPQPLPANMTFNRGTGELTFAPAPGQAGTYDFSVAVTGGTRSGTVVLPVTVTDPSVLSTEISGQVVDEDGRPLAGMPVSIGTDTTVTNQQGDFTLTDVPASPGPISAGGSVAQAEDRLPLTAPIPQLLGHAIYLGAKNVLPTPLIVPKVEWSSPSSFSQESTSEPVDITNPAIPGFGIQVPANSSPGAAPVSGTLQVAELPASLAAQHMPQGVSADMYLYKITGGNLSQPARLSLPGGPGLQPGTALNLMTFNPRTGGHDILTPMVVSSNGQSMVSAGVITLAAVGAGRSSKSSAGVRPDFTSNGGGSSGSAGGTQHYSGCLYEVPSPPVATPITNCPTCQTMAAAAAGAGAAAAAAAAGAAGNPPLLQNRAAAAAGSAGSGGYSGSGSGGYSGSGSGSGGSGGYSGSGSSGSGGYSGSGSGGPFQPQARVMDSNAGLVTGEYFLNHQLVSYQSQGQSIGINLQYSSAQADPNPIVQYEFTTPPAGDSQDITSVDVKLNLGGVLQGSGTTYLTPNGLNNSETYNIPVQVDASQLATGVYSYTMTATENFQIPVYNPNDPDEQPYDTSITSTVGGSVTVINATQDPLGAGWSIGGLQHLAQVSPGGPVLITAGQQGTEQYDPVYNDGQTVVQDLALASNNSPAQILANDSSAGFAAVSNVTLNGGVLGTVAGDFNGDGKPDMAIVTSSTLAIQLNNGAGGFTTGSTYSIPSGYEAKAIAVGNFSGHSNGVLDLAVLLASTSTDAYSVAEYTGNGNGTFAAPVISAAGNGVASGTSADTMAAADFNGDGLTDLAFNTDNGLADVMLATGGGSFGAATALALPSGHTAIGVTTTGQVAQGDVALVVEVNNADVNEDGIPFVALDAFSATGSGGLSYTSTDQTVGQIDDATLGLVAGDFQGEGLEVAVPVTDGGGGHAYLDVVPLATFGDPGIGVLYPIGMYSLYTGYQIGNIVAADLNGTGKDSIALINADAGQLDVLVPDPASDQFLPLETVPISSIGSSNVDMIAAAPFMGTAIQPSYRPPADTPSSLVQNSNGTWTRTDPDGTVVQFNSSGQETSISDRNGNTFTYAYFTSGPAAGALATITDPVGLVTTLAYDSSGHLSTITDPAGRVTSFTVDSAGDLTQITDPDGAVTQYGYDASHEATSETDPDNHTATAQYNSFGQLTSETLFDGTSTTSIDAAQSNGLLTQGGSGPLPTTYAGSVTNPDGHTSTVSFNAQSHPSQETTADGGQTTITTDWRGFPSAVTDAMGRSTTYIYDGLNGQPISITEPYPYGASGTRGRGQPTTATETIAYNDPYGIPTSITDFDGNTTTFVLDSHGNVLEEEQPGGVDQEWTYNSAGQVLTHTDADGHTTTYTYDSLGRLTTITEPLPGSPTIRYTYDQAGEVTSVTDAAGDTTTYTYDAMGRVLTEQNPVQAAAGKEVSFTYDPDGNLLTATDAMGRTTAYTYNARDELSTETDPMGRVTSYGYDATGNLTSVTDPMGRITTYTYNGDNDLATMTDPMGGVTQYDYNAADQLIQVNSPNGPATLYTYDNVGNLSGVQAPFYYGEGEYSDEVVATYTYDPNGNRISSIDGDDHITQYTYNALNELTKITNADGDTTQYTYDGDGDVLTETDGLGHTTSYTYDALGDVLTETQPTGGGTTTYTYDGAGDLLSVTDPDGNVTSYTYTAAHQVATETTPTGGVTTYTYDLDGELTQSVDPDGHTIDYTYDADGEETSETWVNPNGGTPLDVIDYTYDADGELTSVSDDNASYQYTYNANGEETSQSDAGSTGLPSVTLDYGYDANGNRTSMSDSLGGVVSYTYDARNELTSLTFSGTGITPEAIKFTYDNQGNMTGLTRYSNLAETTLVAATSYTYDNANQMTGITDENSSGTTLVSYGYTYDAAGRVTQEARTWNSGEDSDTLTYGYTDNNQLTSVTHTNSAFANESFSWDANGNETGTGYTTSTGNEQTASPGYTYTYDADGNMVTATDTSTGDVWTYTYNFAGQMTGAVETNSDDTVLAQTTYTYDALGNRIGIDDNGTQTWTLYDGSDPVMDFDGLGSLEARYLNGPAGQLVDTVLSRQSASGTVAWYLPDRLGTIRDLIDNSGNIIDHVDYSAFGTVLGESSPANGDRMMGFAGMERDTVTGLNLAVHRVQNPATGRWTSQDPMGFGAGDVNLDRYVGNGPVDANDPAGLQSDPDGAPLVPVEKHYPAGWPGLEYLLKYDRDIEDRMATDWANTTRDKEQGMWVLWNQTTGSVATTKRGIAWDDEGNLINTKPVFPGWVVMGHIHSHKRGPSSARPSTQDHNAMRKFGIPGCSYRGHQMHMYWVNEFHNGPGPNKHIQRPLPPPKIIGDFPNPLGPGGSFLS